MSNNAQFYGSFRGANDEYAQRAWFPTPTESDTFSSEGGDSNRKRLDSGSFSNSSDSLQGKKKRRSHRPRGCRGGGSRRNRRAMRAAAAAAEAALGEAESLQENVKPSDYLDLPGGTRNNSNGSQRQDGVFKDTSLYTVSVPPMLEPNMSNMSNSSTGSWPTGGYDPFSAYTNQPAMSQSQRTLTDSQEYQYPPPPVTGGGRDAPYGNQFRHEYTSMNSRQAPEIFHSERGSYYDASKGGLDVLPPLPVDCTEKKKENLEGPNPYALGFNSRQFQPKVNQVQAATELATRRTDSNENGQELTGPDDRGGRIEKQRQMLAGGGSLFVTSPRSFLMGYKK